MVPGASILQTISKTKMNSDFDFLNSNSTKKKKAKLAFIQSTKHLFADDSSLSEKAKSQKRKRCEDLKSSGDNDRTIHHLDYILNGLESTLIDCKNLNGFSLLLLELLGLLSNTASDLKTILCSGSNERILKIFPKLIAKLKDTFINQCVVIWLHSCILHGIKSTKESIRCLLYIFTHPIKEVGISDNKTMRTSSTSSFRRAEKQLKKRKSMQRKLQIIIAKHFHRNSSSNIDKVTYELSGTIETPPVPSTSSNTSLLIPSDILALNALSKLLLPPSYSHTCVHKNVNNIDEFEDSIPVSSALSSTSDNHNHDNSSYKIKNHLENEFVNLQGVSILVSALQKRCKHTFKHFNQYSSDTSSNGKHDPMHDDFTVIENLEVIHQLLQVLDHMNCWNIARMDSNITENDSISNASSENSRITDGRATIPRTGLFTRSEGQVCIINIINIIQLCLKNLKGEPRQFHGILSHHNQSSSSNMSINNHTLTVSWVDLLSVCLKLLASIVNHNLEACEVVANRGGTRLLLRLFLWLISLRLNDDHSYSLKSFGSLTMCSSDDITDSTRFTTTPTHSTNTIGNSSRDSISNKIMMELSENTFDIEIVTLGVLINLVEISHQNRTIVRLCRFSHLCYDNLEFVILLIRIINQSASLSASKSVSDASCDDMEPTAAETTVSKAEDMIFNTYLVLFVSCMLKDQGGSIKEKLMRELSNTGVVFMKQIVSGFLSLQQKAGALTKDTIQSVSAIMTILESIGKLS